ncbi:hypothetical protein [Thermoanaerobacterium sp. RBIITD]|uniref:hypothetical protein n=1 Tax=Thermoanaerobacterium sp. RBIITD TaxID=1550240 RepID=UPI001E346B3A|nr:hypothetical protein [Thermoanaerobacterium sp. RBIITD]
MILISIQSYMTKTFHMNLGKEIIMKLAVLALTNNGAKLAKKISDKFKADLYLPKKYSYYGVNTIDKSFIEFVHSIFKNYKGFIFIMATGIVVRAIAKVIENKRQDSAIIVIDEKGNYVISLLSGHIGGAN